MIHETVSSDFGSTEFEQIMRVVKDYFDGLHQGDVEKLRNIFHKDAFLKTPEKRRSLQEWLDDVAQRPTPEALGRPYRYRLLSIDLVADQAMIKLECPLFDYFYIDYLGLLKEGGRWRVVNKMYTDIKGK